MSEKPKDNSPWPASLRHPKLEFFLAPVARRIRIAELLHRRLKLIRLSLLTNASLAILSLFLPSFAPSIFVIGAHATAILLAIGMLRHRSARIDFPAAARRIEKAHPELNQSLVTAVNQLATGNADFFSLATAEQALASPSRQNWETVGRTESLLNRINYLATLCLSLFALLGLQRLSQNPVSIIPAFNQSPSLTLSAPSIEPGNAEIEQGSPILITARFTGEVPSNAELIITSAQGIEQSIPMAQSLSDPVFAHSIPGIQRDFQYRIRYADRASESYRVTVFERPELLQANAFLDFPDYTQWSDRSIEDTLKLSAIEGTALKYTFNLNKPVSEAYLRDEDNNIIPLVATNPESTQFSLDLSLQTSLRLALHLVDRDGRPNASPDEIRIDVLPNKRPLVRIEHPSSDQRLSPIQEVLFRANASDDFGLLDYGIAYSIGAESPTLLSLKDSPDLIAALDADFETLLPLETLDLEPKDSISWYAWADDFDAFGEPRRSTSDLFFGQIRALDEIYREQDGGGMGQGQPQGQGIELIEKQRRISISLFRIKNTATNPEDAREDLETIHASQFEADQELRSLVTELREPAARQAATEALRYMEGVDVGLTNAIDTPSLEPLDPAWSDSQGAFQALVRLTESEFSVSRNQAQGQGGGQSTNQAQLDELEFNQAENRYETATQAQSLGTPEEQQNLELLNKLKDLSRRQQDMNDRLQEMQSALAQAKTEEERERIRRELKRLEEEQRELLADADEAIQQASSRQSARSTREQLENIREDMQQAGDQLQQGEVSQALASGSRARESLENSQEQLRQQSTNQFSEAVRNARNQARQLADSQKQLEQEIESLASGENRRLDDSAERANIAEALEQQSEAVENYLQDLRQIVEGAEAAEPGLYRSLYKTLRENSGSQFEEEYQVGAQLLRQGFVDDALQSQEGLSEQLQRLSEQIAESAESILGNERSELQFARSELEELTNQIDQERSDNESSGNPSNSSNGSPSNRQSSPPSDSSASTPSQSSGRGQNFEDLFRNAFDSIERSNTAPLTGSGFSDWVDRLRMVEAVVGEPEARNRIAEAREVAEDIRRDFRRRGELPQWEMIEADILTPLDEARFWIQQELRKIEDPDALQAIDSDPVPDAFADAVKRYYESLGNE